MVYPFVARHYTSHVTYVVILGLMYGSCYVTITAVSLKFIEINYLSAAIGIQFFFCGLGSDMGPVCGGKVLQLVIFKMNV